MNWFILTKFAQVWKIESDGSFPSEVKKFYELEYKRSFLINNEFRGLGQRKENILKKIDQELMRTCELIKKPLLNVFEKWLKNHAITNPKQFAEARVEEVYGQDYSNEEAFNSMLYEWQRYNKNIKNPETEMFHVIQNFESLTEFFELQSDSMKQMEEEDLNYSGIENYNNANGTEFKTIEEARNYIQNKPAESYSDISYYDFESFINTLDNLGIITNFMEEFYEKIIFPIWFDYWKKKGIVKTRENNESIYNMLLKARDIKDNILAINWAIHSAHQNGNMIDYLEEYGRVQYDYEEHGSLEGLLNYLSNENNMGLIAEWEEEMKRIGVNKSYNTEIK